MTQSYVFTFSVFTPTYNRASLLPRVYASLKAQTFTDFEWIIIDDGSSDGTRRMVAAWQKEAFFPLRYRWQENQGKHAAFNRAVELARGRFFLPLDSDDEALPHALERLLHHWESISPDQRQGFTGVTARCQDARGGLVGPPLPQPVLDSDAIAIKRRYGHSAEKWGFNRTGLLKDHPYPEMPGALFMPEDLVWCALAKTHQTRFVDEPLRIYHQAGDQLTRSALSKAQVPGLRRWHQAKLNGQIDWLWQDLHGFLRSAWNYARFSFLEGCGLGQQAAGLQNSKARLLWALMLLPGWLLSLRGPRTR